MPGRQISRFGRVIRQELSAKLLSDGAGSPDRRLMKRVGWSRMFAEFLMYAVSELLRDVPLQSFSGSKDQESRDFAWRLTRLRDEAAGLARDLSRSNWRKFDE